ncbi:elongator complex protein 2 [Trichoderma asperellum]|uniref:Elongator complex protein 2 n=1 Tax=Trichoderma asperellum TaxID=101201 RepID=A0A6V8QWK6_TRIAP|nr:WD40 repeat-like protein [Trichoderma asperelloides]GFP55328.1 elongator complex protein 2 [Trichoderma asperellum]
MGSNGLTVEHLAAGANRQTAVADWSRTGLLAYGADCNIALWRPAADPPRGVFKLLNGHKETVKALAFLPELENEPSSYFISGSDDKTIAVWKSSDGGQDFKLLQTASEHTGPVNCVTALRVTAEQSKWIVATGAADATIRIWSFENDQLELIQTINTTPKYFPLCLSLSVLGADDGAYILASAGTKDVIQILTAEAKADKAQFTLQATLSGHEGWLRSLSFAKETYSPDSDLLLASASQDKYIRIWRVHQGKELPALAAEGSDPSSGAFMPGKSPSNKAHWLKISDQDFSVTFEALLLGHEDWIYSAKWHSQADGKLQLLSASADNSLAIWEADPGSGIWVSMVRLGEISREKGATTATGSTGGFWTGLWSPNGKSVACLGRTGSWRRWEYDASEDMWRPRIAISGHTKAVTGISWSKDGGFLLSTGSDQTTRLHMKWKSHGTWHEMSRPQIHGYDLNCIDSLGSSQFVSGADEKLMRVFSEPKAVATMLNRLGGIDGANIADMPDAANMPVLGLSNKAIDTLDDDQEIQPIDDRDRDAIDPASIVKKSYLDIDHPPFEETLSRHTLWPEMEKLYGHGYEISCLAASHDGKLIASACKASSINHAVIRIFETEKWTELRPPLAAHSLTATRLRFSSNDKYLLSVGRDRQWAIFERGVEEDSAIQYQLLQSNAKGHSRMILDAAWAPSSVPLFATAGRDKQVRVWSLSKQGGEDAKPQFTQVSSLASDGPVTSVDFLTQPVGNKYVLAVGTESGRVSLCTVAEDGSSILELPTSPELILPKTVLQLAWRPVSRDEKEARYELAVAGEDSSLRLYGFGEEYFNEQKQS